MAEPLSNSRQIATAEVLSEKFREAAYRVQLVGESEFSIWYKTADISYFAPKPCLACGTPIPSKQVLYAFARTARDGYLCPRCLENAAPVARDAMRREENPPTAQPVKASSVQPPPSGWDKFRRYLPPTEPSPP